VAPWSVLVIGLCTAAAAWYTDASVRALHQSSAARELQNEATLVAPQFEPLLAVGAHAQVHQLCRSLGPDAHVRLTVIDPAGVVWGDSEEVDPSVMANHGSRPEVVEAYAGRIGTGQRVSPTLRVDMMYVAIPVWHNGKIIGVVRTAYALSDLAASLRAVHIEIVSAGAITAAAVVVALLILLRRRITRPLQDLEDGARRFAQGDLAHTLPVPDSREIGGLAEALNQMARQLDEKIRTVTDQALERQAVLSGMIEGVIALDAQERILTLNIAATRLLGINPDAVQGRKLFEVVRNAGLLRLVERTLSGGQVVEASLVLRVGEEEQSFDGHGSALRGPDGQVAGAVIVLHNVTQLRRLERVRRDFVANVSHELKTPITAIKGAVETLIDNGGSDASAAARFLPMIARHADRLGALVDDLLTLARVEQAEERPQTPLEAQPILPVLQAVREVFEVAAEARGTTVEVAADPGLRALCDVALLEQAVANLLDNAIKYCPPGSQVQVTAQAVGTEVVIAVKDNGPGIEPEHLPRLFERFYRPDRDRSRDTGGTGLGLAIVKHVAQVHGGRASVESTRGKGSIFRVHLRPA
jgi:two-component system phosphate regulon sensor histidine kinase PhoR